MLRASGKRGRGLFLEGRMELAASRKASGFSGRQEPGSAPFYNPEFTEAAL